ncbi:hypothetical protein BKA65DRAFT_536981 [Rhexocercosporidium sp. MPI-PUGE-AT-0058]|nr:hypothetical protein BKA65DRAFT_536981 [Rhexocercosporidium sp. MPI-PUGE-AT-0058]
MAITRKRKSCIPAGDEETVCKRTRCASPAQQHIRESPQTPQPSKKRITIRLITPSAPRKIRLRVPAMKRRVVTPYPSPPLESTGRSEDIFGTRDDDRSREQGDTGGKRDVNDLLELYCLADGFGQEGLTTEVLSKLERGDWTDKVTRESLERCFTELGSGDEVRRWIVKELVKLWTGGEGLGFVGGGEVENWSWVGEGMREDVLSALRDGEGL